MNILRWLSRAEKALCLLGLAMTIIVLTASTVAQLSGGQDLDWANPLAFLGLLLLALFGIGPAAAKGAHLRLLGIDWLCPPAVRGFVRSAGYLLTASVFFVLFCLATYVSSETRALGEVLAVLGWPLWLLQSLMVVAFGANVVRFSVYAVDSTLRPIDCADSIFPADLGR